VGVAEDNVDEETSKIPPELHDFLRIRQEMQPDDELEHMDTTSVQCYTEGQAQFWQWQSNIQNAIGSQSSLCKQRGFDVFNQSASDWRMKERFKTVSVALVLCLNIGVEPPDVLKTKPCAKLETWIDPSGLPPPKALETIGRNLQQQYEVWQPRARYKLLLDPTVEETKKLCTSLRRHAKEERVLFHYNGHGVPKPTANGEIWVFNKTYTQYIPISMFEVQGWLGEPSIFVYDCSSAGHILNAVSKVATQKDPDAHHFHSQPRTQPQGSINNLAFAPAPTPAPSPPESKLSHSVDFIQFAACRADEVLPMNPDLPADVFTSCLTTPIDIALRVYILQHPHLKDLAVNLDLRLPGRLNDRRTPLGELNWIFTAITDTIAWNVLPHDLFKKLFRQDLMVAALFRNFLLADRVMRKYQCTPQSTPMLPATHQHPLWNAWDLAVDMCLVQLPALVAAENGGPPVEYRHSTFFTEQLTALDVWLSHGPVYRKPPEQVPIVLQVLLSQVHRLRALILLSRFLELGSWAVNLALTVGIFPYVLKLLQSPAAELKPVLVFIWSRILAVDESCQADLMKDSVYTYFVSILGETDTSMNNLADHQTMCAFILSKVCHNHNAGQQACLKSGVLKGCMRHLSEKEAPLKKWSALCIGELWNNCEEAKWAGVHLNVHESLCHLLVDEHVEVRASAVSSLGKLFGIAKRNEQVTNVEHIVAINLVVASSDASPVVRRELVLALSNFVIGYMEQFVVVAQDVLEASHQQRLQQQHATTDGRSARRRSVELFSMRFKQDVAQDTNKANYLTVYRTVWLALLTLCADPFHQVHSSARNLVDLVSMELLMSPTFSPPVHNLFTKPTSIHSSPSDSSPEDKKLISAQTPIPVLKPQDDNPPQWGFKASLRRSASNTFSSFRSLTNLNALSKWGSRTQSQMSFRDDADHLPESTPISQQDIPRTHSRLSIQEDNSKPVFNSLWYHWCCLHFTEPVSKVLLFPCHF
jgi:regulator-associated protein of mTOR